MSRVDYGVVRKLKLGIGICMCLIVILVCEDRVNRRGMAEGELREYLRDYTFVDTTKYEVMLFEQFYFIEFKDILNEVKRINTLVEVQTRINDTQTQTLVDLQAKITHITGELERVR